jgi:hypothetical protein
MSYEICESCGKEGDTDNDDGGRFEQYRNGFLVLNLYTCARCVKAQIAAEDPPGDEWEERQIREREYHDDKASERTDLHTPTQPGDLDLAGRPLKQGS